MRRHEILACFEHRPDGAFECVRDLRLTTRRASVDIRRGARFTYGTRVAGLDLAEYLGQLGAQFGA